MLLGAGTGLSTVANLALMLDVTLPGYLVVFGLEVVMLVAAAGLLETINAQSFQRQVSSPSALERAALAD